jgi:hypothetical protein
LWNLSWFRFKYFEILNAFFYKKYDVHHGKTTQLLSDDHKTKISGIKLPGSGNKICYGPGRQPGSALTYLGSRKQRDRKEIREEDIPGSPDAMRAAVQWHGGREAQPKHPTGHTLAILHIALRNHSAFHTLQRLWRQSTPWVL